MYRTGDGLEAGMIDWEYRIDVEISARSLRYLGRKERGWKAVIGGLSIRVCRAVSEIFQS
jgi:hypothetical protein